MRRQDRTIPALVALLLAFIAAPERPASARVACPAPMAEGTPPVKAQHIFCGEINRSGKAVGFHSRPGGSNPDSIDNTRSPRPDPRRPGIYTLSRFRINEDGQSATKALSTMFPDHCSAEDVLAAIRHAFNTGRRSDGAFSGMSGTRCTDLNGQAFHIQGFTGTMSGRTFIITAYPN